MPNPYKKYLTKKIGHLFRSDGIYETIMRVVIDTNVLVSALKSSRGASYILLLYDFFIEEARVTV